MTKYLLILPIACLVTYSQIVVKWRMGGTYAEPTVSFSERILMLLKDPVILSAYAAALFASFAWLYVITKLPLSVAFPLYIGTIFIMVVFGGWFFLAETITITRIVAILLIFIGIILGVSSDA